MLLLSLMVSGVVVMKRKSIVLGILAAFIGSFVGFTRPAAAAGTCIGISGSYSANSTSFISPTFPLQKNDNVFVTSTGSSSKVTGVGAIIIINGHQSVFQAAGNAVGGSASAAATG